MAVALAAVFILLATISRPPPVVPKDPVHILPSEKKATLEKVHGAAPGASLER
jgi:hypothetical protein